MPSQYTGTPLESDWEKLQRRRAVNDAITKQSMAPYQGTEMVSGRAVDDRWGQGLGKIGQAIVGAMGTHSANKEADALGKQFDTGRADALDRVKAALSGQGNVVGPDGPRQPKPDPMKAAMELQDPYLQNNEISRALINSSSYGGGGRYRERHSMTPGKKGYVSYNQQTGETEYSPWPKEGFVPINKDPSVEYQMSGAGQQGEKDVDLNMNPKIKSATDLAERDAEKIIDKPKIDSTLSAADTKTQMLGGLIDKAKGQGSAWTTGFLGTATSWIPGTPAHNLGKTLDTIKSNIGFDKLQEMRNNSPTGGALGQVSEFENRLLQAVWGALEQSQSPTQFEENLDLVNKQVDESWKRVKAAYKQDYGTEYQSGGFSDSDKEKRYQEWKANQ